MRKSFLLAMMALVTAGHALAAEPEDTKPAEKPRLICRTDKMTGSLTNRTRTCLTAEQWNARSEASRRDFDRYVRDSSNVVGAGQTNPTPGPGGR